MITTDRIEIPDPPPNWRVIEWKLDGYACQYRYLRVIVSAALELDNRCWLHVSVSRRGGWLVGWDDLKLVKECFIGADKTALIILPPAAKYVNISEVHHLWHCLDGDVTPDFTRGSGSI